MTWTKLISLCHSDVTSTILFCIFYLSSLFSLSSSLCHPPHLAYFECTEMSRACKCATSSSPVPSFPPSTILETTVSTYILLMLTLEILTCIFNFKIIRVISVPSFNFESYQIFFPPSERP